MSNKKADVQEVLSRGVENVIEKEHLKKALASRRKLRIKLGIDPTAPNLHIGHAVVLDKLRQFQDLGHKAVLIIGDFTAVIGDPSGRAEARKPLSATAVKKNEKSYLAQAGKIIDLKKTEIRHNSEWLAKKGLTAILELSGAATVQQILKRQDFARRIAEDKDVTMLETLYPLLQGYDSVAVRADVELGGTDQLLNLLMGRKVQRHYRAPEQDVLTVFLLEGLDGSKKMSKSVGNTIDMLDNPEDMFGKTMSLPDSLIIRWFTLATAVPLEEVREHEKELQKGENPKTIKEKLAFEIVKRYHGEKAALKAAENFNKIFAEKRVGAADIPELAVPKKAILLELVMLSGVVPSKSEARRLIEQGAVSIGEEVQKEPGEKVSLKDGTVFKVGKKNFFRLKAG